MAFAEFQEQLVQALLAAGSTFIAEDPTTIGVGLLIAEGAMGFWLGYFAVATGIALGDFGLYGLGRFFRPQIVKWGLVSDTRLERATAWFSRNLIVALVVSRFVPGMRLPTYTAAGILKAHPIRFLTTVVILSLIWTALLMGTVVLVGEALLPHLGIFKWGIVAAVLVAVFLLQRSVGKRIAASEEEPKRVVSSFEFWPPLIFYIPVALYCIALSIKHFFRSGSLLVLTASNPSIRSGGFIGESKSQIMRLVSKAHRLRVARFVALKKTKADSSRLPVLMTKVTSKMNAAGIDFPIVAKPDKGQRGAGVRPIKNEEELAAYLEQFPYRNSVIIQKLATGACEAGIFYYRKPGEEHGIVSSITLKEFPEVVGDGRLTLRELIMKDDRAQHLSEVYLARHAERLDEVVEKDLSVPLVFAGNHCQGTVFLDGTHLVTEPMTRAFDQIARSMPGFYFGRFDIRFDSIEDLQAGEGFEIFEINGAGAESTHIWDANMRLGEAYRALFEQFRVLYEIGAENVRRGYKPLGAAELLGDLIRYATTARQYPPTA